MAATALNKIEGTKRKDAYQMNPSIINIDWDSNPRKDYGTDEEQAELRDSIRENNLQVPIHVYIDKKDGKVWLAHGFRRMKQVTQLLAENVDIAYVPVIQVENNMETIMALHWTLNSGKQLNDLEKSETLLTMFKLMGEDYQAVADKLKIPYMKVYNLIHYQKEASSLNKKMVENKEISMTTAREIAAATSSTEEQNTVLENARKNAQKNGRTTIKPQDITGVKLNNNKKTETYKSLKGYINYMQTRGVQTVAVADMVTAIEKIEKGTSLDELISEFLALEA